jgi:hypothetical protein
MSDRDAVEHLKRANEWVRKADDMARTLQPTVTRNAEAVQALAALAAVHITLAQWEL